MKRLGSILILIGAASVVGCVGDVETGRSPDDPVIPPGATGGDEENTFDHDNSSVDPFDLLERLAIEGPPKYSARMHGCTKLRYDTLGNVLRSLGVNVDDATALSAGSLYRNGYNALGGSNDPARVRENIDVTTSAASRTFDVFAAAAPEIIANLSTTERCPGVEIFDGSDQCQASGITCLIGVPATDAHIELCNLTVSRATSPEVGRELAVATLLAAAHTCE